MKKILLALLVCHLVLSGCEHKSNKPESNNKEVSTCGDKCEAKNKETTLSCKLTSPELQERKETVLASLKKQVLEKKELPDGYAFRFSGSDKMIDELTEFIKTERECCNFFTFNLSISGDKEEAWLELKSKDGGKDFINAEMGL